MWAIFFMTALPRRPIERDVAYGVQAEGAWHLGSEHTVRFGMLFQADDIASRTSSLVLPTDSGGPGNPNPNPLCTDPSQTCQTSGTPLAIADNGTKHAWAYGVYVQDEWKIFPRLTLNYGVRYDQYGAFDSENQLSPPRQSGVDADRHHHGACRLCPAISRRRRSNWWRAPISRCSTTPPPPAITPTTVPKAERADYYDLGMVQKLFEGAQLGVDGFFKASHDLIDEGQFGAPIVLTPFNYQTGRQYGGEFSFNYQADGFTAMSTRPMSVPMAATSSPASSSSIPTIYAYIANLLYSARSSTDRHRFGGGVLQME